VLDQAACVEGTLPAGCEMNKYRIIFDSRNAMVITAYTAEQAEREAKFMVWKHTGKWPEVQRVEDAEHE
jgi:hypothetical protein